MEKSFRINVLISMLHLYYLFILNGFATVQHRMPPKNITKVKKYRKYSGKAFSNRKWELFSCNKFSREVIEFVKWYLFCST